MSSQTEVARNGTAGQPPIRVSQTSQQRQDCSRALAHLCLMKRQATFSKEEANCWVTVLAIFRTETVNEAMLRLGLSTDPFPDLGKLVAACQQVQAEQDPRPVRGDQGPTKPSKTVIQQAAAALGLSLPKPAAPVFATPRVTQKRTPDARISQLLALNEKQAFRIEKLKAYAQTLSEEIHRGQAE